MITVGVVVLAVVIGRVVALDGVGIGDAILAVLAVCGLMLGDVRLPQRPHVAILPEAGFTFRPAYRMLMAATICLALLLAAGGYSLYRLISPRPLGGSGDATAVGGVGPAIVFVDDGAAAERLEALRRERFAGGYREARLLFYEGRVSRWGESRENP